MCDDIFANFADNRFLIVRPPRMCFFVVGDVGCDLSPDVETAAAPARDLVREPRVVLAEASRRYQQKEIVSLHLKHIYTHNDCVFHLHVKTFLFNCLDN